MRDYSHSDVIIETFSELTVYDEPIVREIPGVNYGGDVANTFGAICHALLQRIEALECRVDELEADKAYRDELELERE